jgi:putative ABC transport system permease protein
MNTLMQDIRFAARMLRKSPGFALIAILTLALGIGANTAIFSVVDAVLLKPLPYPQPDRIAAVWGTHSKMGETSRAISFPDFRDLQEQNHVFEHIAVYTDDTTSLTGTGEPLHLFAEKVSADMFSVLGIQPILGRAFLPGEDQRGHYVAMISYRLWQSHFGADPGIVGRAVTFGGRDYTIVGVLPASLVYPFNSDVPDVWRTFAEDATPSSSDPPMTEERGAHFVGSLARLRPGITYAQANSEVDAIGNRLADQYPDTNKYTTFRIESALDSLVGSLKPQLRVLLGAVAFVLLIGCANIANLLLARTTARQREMAIRSAMGAGRARIMRQLLIEAGMISLAGGACGLIVAAWGTEYLVKLASDQFPRVAGTALDARVLAFTFIASVVTGFLFGIAPALQLSSQPLSEILREGGRSSSQSARQHRLRNILIVGEMALAVILLTCAGLLIESLSNLQHVNPGFNSHGVLTFAIDLPSSRYSKPEAIKSFFRQLSDRIRALPGVKSASTGVPLPFSDAVIRTTYQIEGRPVPKSEEPHVHFRAVNVDYFRTMQIPLLKGRAFAATDTATSPNVIVINQALASKAFPGEDPIGKHIKPGVSESGPAPFREIVGVAGNVKVRRLDSADEAECYTPEEQTGFDWQYGVVRTSVPPATLIPAIRDQVLAIDKDVAIFDAKTIDEYLVKATAQPRLDSALLALFAGLALILAMVGIYGVMSYGVAQRTNEFGIRMTLGAQRGDMMGLVLKQGLGVAAIGAAVGIAAAVGATRLLSSLLFGVKPGDPITLLAVSAILLVCALVACYLPARRAMRVDPMVALRYE